MSLPLLVIVGADKGGVGKTTLSRILLDYCKTKYTTFRAFDTETPKGSLHRFYPSDSDIVDLTKSDDQMKVFDNLSDSSTTVIDVRAGLLSPTLKVLSEIGFLQMVRDGKIKIVVLHVIGPAISSIEEIKATKEILAGSQHFIVKNHINDSEFFDGIDSIAKDAFNSETLDIPKLDERTTEYVDASGMTFLDFAANAESQTLRGKVNYWLSLCFAQLDRTNLLNKP